MLRSLQTGMPEMSWRWNVERQGCEILDWSSSTTSHRCLDSCNNLLGNARFSSSPSPQLQVWHAQFCPPNTTCPAAPDYGVCTSLQSYRTRFAWLRPLSVTAEVEAMARVTSRQVHAKLSRAVIDALLTHGGLVHDMSIQKSVH